MYIQFDKNQMHVQVIVGTLESYAPNDKIKEIQARVDALKEQITKFQSEVVFPELSEIDTLIEAANPKPETETESPK